MSPQDDALQVEYTVGSLPCVARLIHQVVDLPWDSFTTYIEYAAFASETDLVEGDQTGSEPAVPYRRHSVRGCHASMVHIVRMEEGDRTSLQFERSA